MIFLKVVAKLLLAICPTAAKAQVCAEAALICNVADVDKAIALCIGGTVV
jgi:hypothetical protein